MLQNTITTHPMFHDSDFPSLENASDKQKELVAQFNAKVAGGEIQMEEAPCLCGSDSFDIVSTYDRYRASQRIVLCHHCGLMRCSPKLTRDSLNWFYGSDFYRALYAEDELIPITPSEYAAESKKREPRRQRALDGIDYNQVRSVAEVGCASGLNLYGFHLDGRDVWGSDPSPHMTALGREMGMDIHQGLTEKLGDRKFDLIIVSHVLEHFSDPIHEMTRIKKSLSETGAIYIEVPDARAFCLDALQAAHLYYFTPKQLVSHMATIGLRPVSENSVEGVHFGMVFVPTDGPPTPDTGGEYALMKDIIRHYERRERLKDLLRKLGVFKIIQAAYWIFRRS